MLIEQFGKSYGAWLHEAAHGRDDRPVITHSEPRSISRETTFEHDLHARRDREQLSAIFTSLCEKVADDLRRKGYWGRTIGIKLRYDDFNTLTRDQTLAEPTADAGTIRAAAGRCLKRVPLERRLRLLGVRVGSLSRADGLARGLADAKDGASSRDRPTRSVADAALNEPAPRPYAGAPQLPLFDGPEGSSTR
jgi:DNA polymerase-4